MNRRSFLGSIAGAWMGGAFARLAPAAPLSVAAVRAGTFDSKALSRLLREHYSNDVVERLVFSDSPLLAMVRRC